MYQDAKKDICSKINTSQRQNSLTSWSSAGIGVKDICLRVDEALERTLLLFPDATIGGWPRPPVIRLIAALKRRWDLRAVGQGRLQDHERSVNAKPGETLRNTYMVTKKISETWYQGASQLVILSGGYASGSNN